MQGRLILTTSPTSMEHFTYINRTESLVRGGELNILNTCALSPLSTFGQPFDSIKLSPIVTPLFWTSLLLHLVYEKNHQRIKI